jgi:hypothetical protein
MPCCGQKRNNLRSNPSPAGSAKAAPVIWRQPQRQPQSGPTSAAPVNVYGHSPHNVSVRYTETSRIVVEGSATRRRYEFLGADPVKMVDSGDAAALLATRFFVRG